MLMDTDQLPNVARDIIVAVSRERVPHVMVLTIDRCLEFMNVLPLFCWAHVVQLIT